jgi:poly-gamma-glutamate capsule biosynthesis protein CapA/YwtB (metallophosphatase superfamily)
MTDRRRSRRGSWPVVGAVLCVALLAGLLASVIGRATTTGSASPATNPPGAAAAGSTTPSRASSSPRATPAASPSGATSSQVPATAGVPVVPVTGFRAPWETTAAREIVAVLAGSSGRYRAVELVATDKDAVLAALSTAAGDIPLGDASRLVVAPDAAALRRDLAAHGDRIGFLRLTEVDPSVRALAWEGASLFGVRRVRDASTWPLRIASGDAATGRTAGLGKPWTLVAAGDINLDGAVAYHVKNLGLGVDFPFAGGSAEIVSRYCCSSRRQLLPRARRTGHAGEIRDLLSSADLSIANFENPAPDHFTYHPGGYRFSADPRLIEGLANAGIDWVSMANNHVGDAGPQGILDTMRNLDRWKIRRGGAGPDLTAARAPSMLDANGTKVAILAYDTIRPAYGAGAGRPGSNQMTAERVRADVAKARSLGARIVIVFPHWGIEYTATPSALQRALAHAAIDAGADLVIGNHPHWAGAVEIYRGKPTFYALGNFVFNIDRSEQTEEGIVLELTFDGGQLLQARMRPYVILDGSQPNFLDPAGSGKLVMDQVFGASRQLLPW